MKLVSSAQLVNTPPPSVPMLIHGGVLPMGGKMCLFGGPKMMKTYLALELAMAMVSGSSFVGYKTTATNIIYLQFEVTEALWHKRIREMWQARGWANAELLWFGTDLKLRILNSASDSVVRLKASLIQRFMEMEKQTTHKNRLLVLDPWYKLILPESNDNYQKSMQAFDEIMQECNCSLIVVHHDTVPHLDEAGKRVKVFHPRGPRLVEGWFDTLIQIDGDVDSSRRTLISEVRHAEAPTPPITIERQNGYFVKV